MMQHEPKQMIRLFLLLPLWGLLGGCGDVLKQPYPAKNYFGIDVGKIAVNAATTSVAPPGDHRPVLLIHAVRVVPPFDAISFVYQTGPAQYVNDYYVNWIASPAALLTAELNDWFTTSDCVIAIAPDSTVRPEYRLETTVTRLSINRTDAAHPVAEIDVQFMMTREFTDATKIIFAVSDASQVSATNDTPAAYAAAWGKAYRTILERLAAKLSLEIKS